MRWTKVWWPCCSSCSSHNTNSWWRTQWMPWNHICCTANGMGLILLRCSSEQENTSFGHNAHWPFTLYHAQAVLYSYCCAVHVAEAGKQEFRPKIFMRPNKYSVILKTLIFTLSFSSTMFNLEFIRTGNSSREPSSIFRGAIRGVLSQQSRRRCQVHLSFKHKGRYEVKERGVLMSQKSQNFHTSNRPHILFSPPLNMPTFAPLPSSHRHLFLSLLLSAC